MWDLWKRSLFHILNGCAHICSPTGSCHGPWNSRVVSLVWPLLASPSAPRRLATDFWILKCFRQIIHTSHADIFVYQYSVMVETTVKQRAFAFIVFDFQNCDNRLRKNKAYDVTHHVPGYSARLWSPGGEVGTVAFKMVSPAPFKSCSGV